MGAFYNVFRPVWSFLSRKRGTRDIDIAILSVRPCMRLSRSDIVTKRLNISYFVQHYGSLVFSVLTSFAKFPRRHPLSGRWIHVGYIKSVIFNQYLAVGLCGKRYKKGHYYGRQWEVICAVSNRVISDDLEWPLKVISVLLWLRVRSLHGDLLAIAKFLFHWWFWTKRSHRNRRSGKTITLRPLVNSHATTLCFKKRSKFGKL